MEEAIAGLPGDPEEALVALAERLQVILDAKREKVRWKLRPVYRSFRETIRPALLERRQQEATLQEPRDLSGLDVKDTGPTQDQA